MIKRKAAFSKYLIIAVFLLLAILFIAKFAGPSIIKLYIETGIGDCSKIPVLCMSPEKQINNPDINKEYLAELIPYDFPKMTILIPKGFTVVQERVTRVYYKKRKPRDSGSVFYLFYQEPDFFPNLYPKLKKEGIGSNYEFIKRVMYAKINDIKGFLDAFFVIMKGIFIPDLGDQKNVRMAQFVLAELKGIVSYNLGGPENYFDCNIFDSSGGFFKIYIKDKERKLDLDKLMAIISTVKSK